MSFPDFRGTPLNMFGDPDSGHFTCNVWGWVCLHGVGNVSQIEGQFTSAKYIELLEEVFLPSLRERDFPFPERIIYIHDRTRMHTGRNVRTWFKEQPNLELLEFPSRVSDLNPVENIWANMINMWQPKDEEEKSSHQLMKHVDTVWEFFRENHNLVYDHISTMQAKLHDVVRNNGGFSTVHIDSVPPF